MVDRSARDKEHSCVAIRDVAGEYGYEKIQRAGSANGDARTDISSSVVAGGAEFCVFSC